MNILEDIELRLYRFAQEIYNSKNYAQSAKDMAVEILNLTTENYNRIRQSKVKP